MISTKGDCLKIFFPLYLFKASKYNILYFVTVSLEIPVLIRFQLLSYMPIEWADLIYGV